MRLEPLATGESRYVDFNDKFIRRDLARVQEVILRSVANHRRVLIISGNGVGKSYIVALLKLAFAYTNEDSVVLGTSSTYSQYVDTMWRPLIEMQKDLKKIGLPGRLIGGKAPQLELDDDWYIKVVSPRKPDELEGRHASDVLVVIEEADKPYITDEHFSSAASSVTDSGDRMVAIANPPKDESNVVYEKMQSDRWHVIQFSSFDSHNVLYDMGEEDTYIPGLVDLPLLAEDWENWHGEQWPGAEKAWNRREYPGITELVDMYERGEMERESIVELLRPGFNHVKHAHEERKDLAEDWYRRRAGVIPPDTAQTFRPFTLEHVSDAVDAKMSRPTSKPLAAGYDVARQGGDWNVLACRYDDTIHVYDRWRGVDHNVNYRMVTAALRQWGEPPIAVDASGEGSATADRIAQRHNVRRFKFGEKATQSQSYKLKWDEALWYLGKFMKNGGTIGGHKDIEKELSAAAREITYSEKYYSSRKDQVIEMTPKEAVKERLGHSPDILDAILMCNHIGSAKAGERSGERLTW